VFGIFDTEGDGPQFTYTIGLHERGLPELLLIGPSPQNIAPIFNHIAASPELCQTLRSLRDGDLFDIGGRFPLKVSIGDATVRRDWTIQVGQYYGVEDYDVVQLIAPDEEGHFPDDPSCGLPWRNWGAVEQKPILN
jgi:hypothetical protein